MSAIDNLYSSEYGNTISAISFFDARLYHNLFFTGEIAGTGGAGEENSGSYQVFSDGTITESATFDPNMSAAAKERFKTYIKRVNILKNPVIRIFPYAGYGSFATGWYETPGALEKKIAELQQDLDNMTADTEEEQEAKNSLKELIKNEEERVDLINNFIANFENKMVAPHALVHPYAIINLAGIMGSVDSETDSFLGRSINFGFDKYFHRRWYETEGDSRGDYAKNPTTTRLIDWGLENPEGSTPYTFQDFIFCKWWNKIPNNRMITLRRYAAPVTDNISFDNWKDVPMDASTERTSKELYDTEKVNEKVAMGHSPLATAITYFGEGTDNKLSSLLSFSARYKWKSLEAKSSPMMVDAQANEQGEGLTSNGILSSAMGAMSVLTGFTRAMKGQVSPMFTAAKSLPPDPYTNGPYENRILGPINVIMNTMMRDRGLEFKQEGLKIKFSYVARPIAGINSKALILDMFSNIMAMTYASGTWFGGMERFRIEPKGMYPFTAGKVMNKLYKGQLFGREGAIRTATSQAFATGTSSLKDIFKEALDGMKNLLSAAWNSVLGVVNGKATPEGQAHAEAANNNFNEFMSNGVTKGIQTVLAGQVLKGATIPYVKHEGALLTGEPVGDWHLTIGNPLNPIAMIGNLVCDGVEITWSDELGPDDFPIGFDATITLKHGLGRDKDAIESMYNRGHGRIYSLPDNFKSSADYLSNVDAATKKAQDLARGENGLMQYTEYSETYFEGGGAGLGKHVFGTLNNSGIAFSEQDRVLYTSLMHGNLNTNKFKHSAYSITPYQMGWLL